MNASSTMSVRLLRLLALMTCLCGLAAVVSTNMAKANTYVDQRCTPAQYWNGVPNNSLHTGIGEVSDASLTLPGVDLGATTWNQPNTVAGWALQCASTAEDVPGSPFGIKLTAPAPANLGQFAMITGGSQQALRYEPKNGQKVFQFWIRTAGNDVPGNSVKFTGRLLGGAPASEGMEWTGSKDQQLSVPGNNAAAAVIGLKCTVDPGAYCPTKVGETIGRITGFAAYVDDRVKPNLEVTSAPADDSWITGTTNVSWKASDGQSGLRRVQMFVDDAVKPYREQVFNCAVANGYGTWGGSAVNQAAAAGTSTPCSTSEQSGTWDIDTSKFGDGVHTMKLCALDFASDPQFMQHNTGGGELCRQFNMNIDNSNPATAEEADAVPTNMSRAENPIDVSWNNPGVQDKGSPIQKAIYEIVNKAGEVVVPEQTITTDGKKNTSANDADAQNVQAIPRLKTPEAAGDFKARIRLIDGVGHVSKVSTVPLHYSCENSGGEVLSVVNMAMGIVHPGEDRNTAEDTMDLKQGQKADLVGTVRGQGGLPVSGADVCINAKPVVDTDMSLLNTTESMQSGAYRTALPAGPSRDLVGVFRQGHREVFSNNRDVVSTAVTVKPSLKLAKKVVRAGGRFDFSGKLPGPYADKVLIVIQDKVGKGWKTFRRYRTRGGGKYHVTYPARGRGLTRPTKFKVRTQVRSQRGYPYKQGNSRVRTITIKPRKH